MQPLKKKSLKKISNFSKIVLVLLSASEKWEKSCYLSTKKILQLLQNCIGPTICIGWEILCLPYLRFFQRLHFSFCISTSHNCPTLPYGLVSGRFYWHALERPNLVTNEISQHLEPFLTLSHMVEIVSLYLVWNFIGLTASQPALLSSKAVILDRLSLSSRLPMQSSPPPVAHYL